MTKNFSMKVQLFGKILLIGLKERVTIPTKSLQLVIVQLNSENKRENKQFKRSCLCIVTHCILPCKSNVFNIQEDESQEHLETDCTGVSHESCGLHLEKERGKLKNLLLQWLM